MTRSRTPYAERREHRRFEGYDVTQPTAGYYRMSLVSGGHAVGICIWYGAPLDPLTGEEIDRGHRWQATANRVPIDLDRVWPACGRSPVDQAEHDYLCSVQRWAAENAPDSAMADPRRRIDLLSTPLPL